MRLDGYELEPIYALSFPVLATQWRGIFEDHHLTNTVFHTSSVRQNAKIS